MEMEIEKNLGVFFSLTFLNNHSLLLSNFFFRIIDEYYKNCHATTTTDFLYQLKSQMIK